MIIYYAYVKYFAIALFLLSLPVVFFIALKILQKWTTGKCRSLVCLSGKTAIVTGGNSGIGYQTALILASRGCRVIIADRDDSTTSRDKIVEITKNENVVLKHLNLASLKSVREFAKDIVDTEERLDILINNAGVGSAGTKLTEDGLNLTMQINYFGHFLLTNLLSDLLKKSAPSRIIFVSSFLAYINNLSLENLNCTKTNSGSIWSTAFAYGNSKLCEIIAANEFAERLKEYGVTSNSLNPGSVYTDIFTSSYRSSGINGFWTLLGNTFLFFFGKTPEEGAQTTLHLALSRELTGVTGKHFWDCISFVMPPKARNKKFCREIWEKSSQLVNLSEEEKLKCNGYF